MKTWKVTYRGIDGKPANELISSDSRDGAFEILKKRGISAIRLEECANCNSANRGRLFVRLSMWAGVCALVIALGFCVFRFLFSNDADDSEPDKSKVNRTVEVTQPRHPKALQVTESEDKPLTKFKTKEEQYFAETNGLSKAMMAKWRFEHRQPAAWTNDSSKIEQPEYATFDFQSEKEIICLLTVEPGDTLLGDGNYGPEFERDFLKSLTQPIIVTKDDTPEQAEWKKMMIETKIDLKARMDAGESISEIMSSTRKEYQRLAEMKDFLADEIRSLRNKDGVTVQDIETCIDAANQMLESRGVAKRKITPVMRKMLMHKCIDYKPETEERK